ncbi:MAG: 23S rRNA pseudouridine(1911/1915/1917) synthase RluD [Gammaproteobacteria bacterium]|nr:23S rRNA pseudouridine(1911/1915/1917) synthase RluD [Gammaproteobacteria bacterium]
MTDAITDESDHRQTQVPESLAGARFDQALAQLFPDVSRTAAKDDIEHGRALLNGAVVKPRTRVEAGDLIDLEHDETPAIAWLPQRTAFEIVYEDPMIAIINKPAGLVTHPGAGNPDQTLVNGLLHWDPALSQLPRGGLIHRLDKDTSGLLVIARNALALRVLTEEMQAREIHREYEAVVNGAMIAGGTVDAPVGRDRNHRTRMAVTGAGRDAITHYRIKERFRAHTWLNVMLETGRTHQIRVHMAHIGHPLVGDATYGGRVRLPPAPHPDLVSAVQGFRRQALHAARLELAHPETGESISFESPLPDDFLALTNALRVDRETAGGGRQ